MTYFRVDAIVVGFRRCISGGRAALVAMGLLFVAGLVGCGGDSLGERGTADECDISSDCPIDGQQCVESHQQNRKYCTPLGCDGDEDCPPETMCGIHPDFGGSICVPADTVYDGAPCDDQQADRHDCSSYYQGQFLHCDGAQWRYVGECPDELPECRGWGEGIRCQEDDEVSPDGVTLIAPGFSCSFEDSAACTPGQDRSLVCVEEVWEINQECATQCRLLHDSEPNVNCQGIDQTCVGCEP